jgi:hypothetical protein
VPASKTLPFDDFTPTIHADFSNDANSSFGDDFATADFVSASSGEGDDEFGDFEGADFLPTTLTAKNTIIPPDATSAAVLEDFDFSESATIRPRLSETHPFDDGSRLFGGLSSEFDDESPVIQPAVLLSASSPKESIGGSSPFGSPSTLGFADRATTSAEPLGPSMHYSSHLTSDGMVEAEVDGHVIKVPADDVSLFFSHVVLLLCSPFDAKMKIFVFRIDCTRS